MLLTWITAAALAQPASTEPKQPSVLWKVALSAPSFGGSAAADVDGDGKLEIAFATYFGDGSVRVLRGFDGSEVWTFKDTHRQRENCLDASVRFADLDGDGRLELVVPGSSSCSVMAFDARSGDLRWAADLEVGDCIDTPPWVGDADGDGKTDVVVGTFRGRLYVIRGADGSIARQIPIAPGAVQSCPIVMDLDGDNVNDYIAANFRGDHALHAVSGADGRELWKLATGSHLYHGPSVGDIDGDGAPDLAIAGYDAKVYACKARDGKPLWTAAPGDHYFMSPTAMLDIDGDGDDEVIAASTHVTAFAGDGSVLYHMPAVLDANVDSVTRGVSIADLDGDDKPDLATLSGHGLFRVFRAADGAVLYEFDAKAVGERPAGDSSHGPLIADFNGDGALDVFFVVGDVDKAGNHGTAICLTGFAGTGEGWYMLRHDEHNTGNPRTALDGALLQRIPRRQ